jgi:hypothetical protein
LQSGNTHTHALAYTKTWFIFDYLFVHECWRR